MGFPGPVPLLPLHCGANATRCVLKDAVFVPTGYNAVEGSNARGAHGRVTHLDPSDNLLAHARFRFRERSAVEDSATARVCETRQEAVQCNCCSDRCRHGMSELLFEVSNNERYSLMLGLKHTCVGRPGTLWRNRSLVLANGKSAAGLGRRATTVQGSQTQGTRFPKTGACAGTFSVVSSRLIWLIHALQTGSCGVSRQHSWSAEDKA